MKEAIARQHKIAKTRPDVRALPTMDGELVAQVDQEVFHTAAAANVGYECWNDEGFISDMGKRHPEIAPRRHGTRTTLGYNRRYSTEFTRIFPNT
jgi:hypothetical protein